MCRNLSALFVVAGLLCSLVHPGFASEMPTAKQFTNSIGMELVRVEPGTFKIGFEGRVLPDELISIRSENSVRKKGFVRMGNVDEHPAHEVTISQPFYMGMYEVKNVQYEQYDIEHKRFRGYHGYSYGDDDAVIMVTWTDAAKFCQWLSEKEGLEYRLPTEAEWEYACRAGTLTYFNTGDSLAGPNVPNAWGLYNMHGGAEEWCYDWYGLYESQAQTDPVGRVDGDYKVIRGGSYSSHSFYLRSANRSGSIPADKSWRIGFRVVLGALPKTKPLPLVKEPYQRNVSQRIPPDIEKGPDPNKPYFEVRRFINIPEGSQGPLHYYHNHNPDIVQCPNGDLLAIFFSTQSESDREMIYGCSRLRYGREQWDKSCVFWAPPDRKAEYSVLWVNNGTIFNFSSLGISGSRPAAIVMRTSHDNGVTWSKARIIADRADEHGVMETVFRTSKGVIVIPADEHNLFVSYDNCLSWSSPCSAKGPAGIHTPMLELNNGDLMAFGRYDDIEGKMPKSISSDMGKTWTISASIFPGIGGGQRATLLRLKEGPILFASFVKKREKMKMIDSTGKEDECIGMYAALSFDEGQSWPLIRLMSDGSGRKFLSRKNKYDTMTAKKAEEGGYLASCQSADGIIHIVSNRVEYAFNLKWLQTHSPAMD